ncbi:hypothetical protein AHiyo1_30640 [Arthrobacter sp. Hiyo1]|nr:hypothetical protein AHiyo1_30640 [Arthrobacter sp. Hiyo1]
MWTSLASDRSVKTEVRPAARLTLASEAAALLFSAVIAVAKSGSPAWITVRPVIWSTQRVRSAAKSAALGTDAAQEFWANIELTTAARDSVPAVWRTVRREICGDTELLLSRCGGRAKGALDAEAQNGRT